MDLFTEIFPITHPPQLVAYTLTLSAPLPDAVRAGRALARRFSRLYSSTWLWSDSLLLTDDTRSAVELMIAIDLFKTDSPDLFNGLEGVEPQTAPVPPQRTADFVIRTALKALEPEMNQALSKFNTMLHTPTAPVRVEREYTLQGWDVRGVPCVSISISTRLTYEQDLQTFAESLDSPADLVGLRVMDRETGMAGDVVKVMGTVTERRDRMLNRSRSEAQQRQITDAPGAGFAVRVKSGARLHELPAHLLKPIIRPRDYGRFGLDRETAERTLRPEPLTRSQMVKALSDIAKAHDLLQKAYNSREQGNLFQAPEAPPYIRFGGKRTRPYNTARLADDFTQLGAYHLRDLYKHDPIEICVVNAIAMTTGDFVEALQRHLARGFEFSINVLRERKIRVVSLANVEAAVRVVEEESPDLILAFLPDGGAIDADGEDIAAYLQSLALGRGFPAHIIYKSTLDDPDSMPAIVMAILAKTGNTPFALADAVDYADYVVGVDIIRDDDKRTLTGIARIYRGDGVFVRYAVRTYPLTDEKIQFVMLRDLFPQRVFGGKRILIHYDGELGDETRQAFKLWGQAIGAVFATVEMIRRGAPRLYAFAAGKVTAPPEGSAFIVDDRQAFFVPAVDPSQPTPQPMRVCSDGVSIENALLSLRVFTLLYYGTLKTPQLPVTTYNAGELAYWLRKGGVFTENEGEVPFWL